MGWPSQSYNPQRVVTEYPLRGFLPGGRVLTSIVAVVSGYLGMAVVVMIGTALAAAVLIPGGISAAKSLKEAPPPNYLYANLALSFVAALFGGWLCARLAPNNPLVHDGALAAILLIMSLLSAKSQASRQPPWYPWTIAVTGVAGVVLGGLWFVASAA
jgi:hypothetical protein